MSNLILPFVVFLTLLYAGIEGAKESFEMIYQMFPSRLAMIFGVNIFIKSKLLDGVLNNITNLLYFFHIPKEIVPMALIRPISGSSSLAILNTIFEKYRPDSYIGKVASTLQGSTDTTFYILTLYFGCIGIKKIRYAMWAGLIADLAGIIASIVFVKILFY